MEGISVGGKMYVYHTTDHTKSVIMGRSVVAVSEDDGNTFNYLYDFSKEHFINVSIVEVNPEDWPGVPKTDAAGLFIFGSGTYRSSDVRLSVSTRTRNRKPVQPLLLRRFGSCGPTNVELPRERRQAAFQRELCGRARQSRITAS